MAKTSQTNACEIVLNESLEARDVEDAREVWLAALWAGCDATVVADGLSRVDTAGLQLLLALRLQVERDGGAMTIHGASPALLRAASTLGLASALGLRSAPDDAVS